MLLTLSKVMGADWELRIDQIPGPREGYELSQLLRYAGHGCTYSNHETGSPWAIQVISGCWQFHQVVSKQINRT